jgi:hypothetical protein
MNFALSRREFIQRSAMAAAALGLPLCPGPNPDESRLTEWTARLRREGLSAETTDPGLRTVRVGELARGTPYVAGTLEEYLKAGGDPLSREPLALSLTRFDCVTLVESCLAVGRVARAGGRPSWDAFGREIERMRYRAGTRGGYATRLHYFSEWIADGARRGLVRDLGAELGGEADTRPLRFMSEHRSSYPALANEEVYRQIGEMERSLDGHPRQVIPTGKIAGVADRVRSGDILAFATAIPGLDVTHAALAYRDPGGTLRVLHAPLSGGVVEITRRTLPGYVAAIRHSTGILIARPVR